MTDPLIERLAELPRYAPPGHSGIPPGPDHAVTSLGPEPLELILVYSPPVSA